MCHKEVEKLTSGQPHGQLQSTSGFALKEAAAEDLEQMTHRQSCGHLQCQHHRHRQDLHRFTKIEGCPSQGGTQIIQVRNL